MEYSKLKNKRILITGGAGFIGGALIRKLLISSECFIWNLDKMSYASDLTGINSCLRGLETNKQKRYQFIRVDLKDKQQVNNAIAKSNPDFVIHLAAESHVDKSIQNPFTFIESNIIGTFNLLECIKEYWLNLQKNRQEFFRLLHVSTDEVFGSTLLDESFTENTPYDPKSPYSASKASSDHLVRAWHNTFNIPILITNCSNNFGPWQYPEKLIPVIISNALSQKNIPIYGDGLNVRDWLFVEDHVDALILVLQKGIIGQSYCIGGNGEKTNIEIAMNICDIIKKYLPSLKDSEKLITLVNDRPGHDRRYSINPKKIKNELGWESKFSYEKSLELTVQWYINNQDWCKKSLLKTSL